jgi:hypothetical protein
MKRLRLAHLYLGCFFAPMLLFFSVSGIWQVLGLQDRRDASGKRSVLAYISSIHTGHGFKARHGSLSSVYLQGFIIAMAAGLIVSIVLGTILAFKYGHGKLAVLSLLVGILVPMTLIWVFAT